MDKSLARMLAARSGSPELAAGIRELPACKRLANALAAILVCWLLLPAPAAVAQPVVDKQLLTNGLGSVTSITNAGDSRLFLTIQTGHVRIWQNGAMLPADFLDVSTLISCCGERGLLSVAFHPNYAANGLLYIYTTNTAGDIEITRYTRSAANPNLADTTTRAVMLTIPHPVNANHNGGQLQFGKDGFLYIGTGDGGSGDDPPCNAQNDASPLGKMLRIDVNQNINQQPWYGVPASNPNAGGAFPRNLTWAKGLRNPFRFAFDRLTGDLWIGDVGQGAREEIDFQPAASAGGQNYGWKVMEGTMCGNGGTTNCPTSPAPPACGSPLYTNPTYEYAHGTGDCAVIGGYVYRGTKDPAFAGVYIYGDLCTGKVWTATTLQTVTIGSLQTFGEGMDGEIYAGTGTGNLYLITHPNTIPTLTALTGNPAPPQSFGTQITWTATATGGIAPLSYKFWRYDSGVGWTMVRDWATSNTWAWTPGPADVGQHDVAVWARSAGSSADFEAVRDTGFFSITSPVTISALNGSPAPPQVFGIPITWTATASGPAPLQYRFWRWDTATGWTIVRDYAASNTFTWTPASTDVGQHDIAVWVKRSSSTFAFDAYRDTGFFAVASNAAIQSLTASPPLPQHQGTPITFTATATGPAPLQYRFWRYDGTTWNMVRDYAASNTWSWTPGPGDVGQHDVAVWVKGSGSSAPYDAVRDTGFFQIQP